MTQAVIFIGLQASGKSSFFNQQFRYSHLLISRDVVKTRHREQRLLQVCLDTQLRFVIDNTNPSIADRAQFIQLAQQAKFEVVGYFFDSPLNDCLAYNRLRPAERQVPDVALRDAVRRLQQPTYAEGFDQLYRVTWHNQQLQVNPIEKSF